ncbi:adenosine kinase [Candidatus Woesearchaeota archaeon]|nr:adenosine kinase [Candidatus Woesearchaeota archaeon]
MSDEETILDVFSIGNALVDVIVESDEEHIKKLDLTKGGHVFVDEKRAKKIIEALNEKNPKILPGGAAANVISTLSFLGKKTAYTGVVGSDEYGQKFIDTFTEDGIRTNIKKVRDHSGYAITIITPDKDRSFATYLGASNKLEEKDIDFETLKKSRLVLIEGFQFYDTKLRDLLINVAKVAKKNKKTVVFDLSSHDLVTQSLPELKSFVKNYVDILFANQEEATAYTNLEPDKAITEINKDVEVVIVKLGENGSMIKTKGEFYEVAAKRVIVADTDGAGDAYTAGFLNEYLNEKTLLESAEFATHTAALAVTKHGARINKEELKKLV